MYAVIETGSKQYRVEVGTELQVELLDVEPGQTITLERVLLVADGDTAAIGRPVVDGAKVTAEVLRRERGVKTISFKYRPKARRRVKKGHRQELTILRIDDIVLDGKSAAKEVRAAEAAARTERERLEEAAARQAAEDEALAAKLAKAAAPKAERGGAGQGPGREARRPGHDRRTKRRRAKADAKAKPTAAPPRPTPAQARQERQAERGRPEEGRPHEEGRVAPMAHKKAGSSSKNGRDSVGQRLGVKRGDGQLVTSGSIIVRQRGMTFLSGTGTGLGHDYTVFATVDGHVRFEHATKNKKRIRVLPGRGGRPQGDAPRPPEGAPGQAPKAATPAKAATREGARQGPAGADRAHRRREAPHQTRRPRAVSSTNPAPATADAIPIDHRRARPVRKAAEENLVKTGIHPKYHEATAKCGSCGSTFTVGSTREELRVDVCNQCHPFFTGKQTIIDTAGQVERFQKRLERSIRA